MLSACCNLQLRVPLNFPQMAIRICEIAITSAPECVPRFDKNRRPCRLGFREHTLKIIGFADAISQGYATKPRPSLIDPASPASLSHS